MTYGRLSDTHEKIDPDLTVDFEITDRRVIRRDDDINPNDEESREFIIKVTCLGNMGQAIDMVMNELSDIEGKWHTHHHDETVYLNC